MPGDEWTAALKPAFDHLIQSPMVAIQLLPVWAGFGGLEYLSDWIQNTALESVPDVWKRLTGAVVRGGILTTNLAYWELAVTKGIVLDENGRIKP